MYNLIPEEYDITESVGSELLTSKLKEMDKVKSFFRRVVNFILWSSVNSNKISLTLRAGIPFLVLWGVSDTATLETLTGSLGSFLVNLGALVSGAITIYALIRKVWFSME